MTAFVKENFSWDGMYLMYQGEFEGSRTMEQIAPNCHPSWYGNQNVGSLRDSSMVRNHLSLGLTSYVRKSRSKSISR